MSLVTGICVLITFLPTDNQLAENGALLVNEHLQISGMENVYAIGDCADIKEPKMAYHAGLHAAVAVENIVRSLSKKSLKIYKPGKPCRYF